MPATRAQRRRTVAKQDYEEKYTHPDLREKIKKRSKPRTRAAKRASGAPASPSS
jgi:hypothetical protein